MSRTTKIRKNKFLDFLPVVCSTLKEKQLFLIISFLKQNHNILYNCDESSTRHTPALNSSPGQAYQATRDCIQQYFRFTLSTGGLETEQHHLPC